MRGEHVRSSGTRLAGVSAVSSMYSDREPTLMYSVNLWYFFHMKLAPVTPGDMYTGISGGSG
jgi:hypothetical protein